MTISSRAWNVATNYLLMVAVAVAAIVASREIVRGLGEDGYGVWSLLQGLTGFVAIAVGGFAPALVRFISRYLGQGRPGVALQVVRTALDLIRVMILIVMIGGVIVYAILPHVFRIPSNLLLEARFCWIPLAIAAIVELRARCPNAVLAGLQRHDLRNWSQIVVVIGQTIFVVILMRLDADLAALGFLKLAAVLMLLVSWEWLTRRTFPIPYRPKVATPLKGAELLRFSGATSVIYLAGTVVYSMDSVVVGAVLGAVWVAFYVPAARLVETVRMMGFAFLNVVVPRASELHAQGKLAELEPLIQRASRLGFFLTGPVLAAGLTVGDRLLVAWLGSSFEKSFPVLIALIIPELVLGGTAVLHASLIAVGAAGGLARIQAGLALANLVLSIWGCYTIGLLGPAVATAATGLLDGLILAPLLYRRQLKAATAPIFSALTRSFLAFALTAGVMFQFLRPAVLDVGLVEILLSSFPFVALGYVVYGFFVLTQTDRQNIASLVGRK